MSISSMNVFSASVLFANISNSNSASLCNLEMRVLVLFMAYNPLLTANFPAGNT